LKASPSSETIRAFDCGKTGFSFAVTASCAVLGVCPSVPARGGGSDGAGEPRGYRILAEVGIEAHRDITQQQPPRRFAAELMQIVDKRFPKSLPG